MSNLRFIFLFVLSASTVLSHAQTYFNEVAQEVGLSGSSWGTDGNENYGGGISFYDFDNDGWDDLTVSSNSDIPVRFYKNNEGTFNLMNFPGIGNGDLLETKSVQWVDYDNDGDYDFFATSNQNTGDCRLYENDGTMNFTDITVISGLSRPGHQSFGASWGDYDKDGLLDVFIVSRFFNSETEFNILYKNNGDGTFTNVSLETNLIQENSLSFCSAWIDYDNDGWQDIYISNDKSQNKNILYHNNQNGTFSNTAEDTGTALEIDAMSTTIGDYNNDGFLDIYVANTQLGNAFLINNGDGTFTNIAEENGTLFQSVAWGSVFMDADLDRDLDLYVSASISNENSGQYSAAFYENDGNGIYVVPSDIGLEDDISISYSNAIGDFNNDGSYDIAVLNCLPDDVFLWKNESIYNHNWIKIKLEGTQSNRQGIGSFIEVSVNGEKQYNYTLLGEGYLGQNSSYEFFGLGTASEIDYIKVTWLSGVEDIIMNPPINTNLLVIEGENPLDTSYFDTSQVSLYPNPSEDILHIDGLEEIANSLLYVYDPIGREILYSRIEEAGYTIDISEWESGLYFLVLQKGTSSETLPFIKK